ANGATVSLGVSQILGALGDAGTIVVNGASVELNANALTIGGGNDLSSTFSGVIADGTGGPGSLVKAGTGILTLCGNNTYSGSTTISGGTLQIGNGGNTGILGKGPVTNNAALVFDRGDSGLVVSSAISGSGSLAQIGSGMLTLGTANSYTGNTIVTGGTLDLGNSSAIQNSTLTTSGAGTLSFGGLSSATFGGLSGSGNLLLANTAGTAVALSVGANNSNTTYSGVLSDNTAGGSLYKLGSGLFTLTGPNTYTGPTTIGSGTLQIGNGVTDGSIASSSGITNNATLIYNLVGGQSYGNVISGSGGLYETGSGTLTLTGSNTFAGPTIVIGGNLVGNTASLPTAITLANNANVTFSQVFNGTFSNTISGNGSLVMQGPGALTMTATNTYTGGTIVGGGILAVANNSALGSGAVTLAGGALSLASATTTPMANAVTLTADSTIDVTGVPSGGFAGALTIGGQRLSVTGSGAGADTAYSLSLGIIGGVSLAGNPTFDVANNGSGVGTLVLGALNDGGSARTITKSGAGALTLFAPASAMNAGDTFNVNGGTFNSSNATALGTLTTVNVASGATLSLGVSQILDALGDAGTVAVNGASVELNGNVLTIGSGNNLSSTFSGVIADGTGGAGSLIKAGAGTFTLGGNNTYSGNTTISSGTLALGSPLALQQSTLDTSGSGVLSFGSLSAATLGGLTGPGTLILANASSSAVALSVGNNGASTTFAGALSGGGSLTKVGSGMLYLAATNAYLGTTAINGGTLGTATTAALPGYATPGQISVANGATLAVSAGGSGWSAVDIGTLLGGNGSGFVNGSMLGIDTSGGGLSYSSNITGSMGLVKLGGNSLVLSGSNTYAG
ncbi:MAG: autotransporter-associated beta strand repeat-containing protein, partial [Thermoguttaceae bacterium]